jgi:cation transport ATPase
LDDSPAGSPLPQAPDSSLAALLDRPASERAREYRYRFAQAAVFGLPVLALQYFGPTLGGREAGLWIGLFQAILTGWIVYVAAAGMWFEGLLLLQRRLTADFIVATVAIIAFAASLVVIAAHLNRQGIPLPLAHFDICVLLLCVWNGWQWKRRERTARA